MTTHPLNSWQAVHDEVFRRIHRREWQPGGLIPNEAALALEFGCARATVNRALRTLAENGVLDRKRKAGTRVALHPVGKAILDIPVIRQEIENKGQSYGYMLLTQEIRQPPLHVRMAMESQADTELLHVKSLHTADGAPYVIEERWINLQSVPAAITADFSTLSANEWLLTNAPYTHGEISFTASIAGPEAADILRAKTDEAVFEVHRKTFDHAAIITTVCLTYRPGYKMTTNL